MTTTSRSVATSIGIDYFISMMAAQKWTDELNTRSGRMSSQPVVNNRIFAEQDSFRREGGQRRIQNTAANPANTTIA
jgi:hypothetical protein